MHYECSINVPISLNKVNIESLINFEYSINKYKEYPYQLNILHTDYNIHFLDQFIINQDNINYIYVENPYNFNRGHTRNLYKYLNLSDNVLFIDIDIPLEKSILITMIEQTNTYDIIKPYDKQLIHLTREEKYKYFIKPFIPNRKPECLFTDTGGITLFKKNVLEECGGYEEFNCYGYEDRCLDVITIHKKYKLKKNDFGLIHLWHEKYINSNKNLQTLVKLSRIFNEKYYNCTYNKKCTKSLHEYCKHKLIYVDKLIEHKKTYNYNLNLFVDNKNTNSIILKPELKI